MTRPSSVLALLLLPACGAHGRSDGEATPSSNGDPVTICVANESYTAGSIRVWVDSFRAMTVASGKRECRQFREVNRATRLIAEGTAGGLAGTTRYEGEISSMGIRCWNWVLRDGATSEIRLVPCDFERDAPQ